MCRRLRRIFPKDNSLAISGNTRTCITFQNGGVQSPGNSRCASESDDGRLHGRKTGINTSQFSGGIRYIHLTLDGPRPVRYESNAVATANSKMS